MAAETQISVTVMLGASITSRIRKAAGRFAGANQGNIAVIFAIALVPVVSWSSIGPGSSCPFTNNNSGFVCTVSPVNASANTSTIPSNGTYSGYICPSIDANSHSFYNSCWTSTAPTTPAAFCTGSSSRCNGANSTYTCRGSFNSKSCEK